jgi:hypothetical protein
VPPPGSLVVGVEAAEGQSGQGAGGEFDDQVEQMVGQVRMPMEAAPMATAGLNAPGDPTGGEGADHHGEADGQPLVGVVGVVLAGGDDEHDVGQGEGEQQLHHHHGGGQAVVSAGA